ncbi:MAG TPA: response regulator transcription factor [Crenotrichaceae bacterium]|nr:MAG: two-component system response regulator [Methylothermaceae bacteria B42]HFD12735.1 response regulator transcription factor [Crenotrichaceae bacterium]
MRTLIVEDEIQLGTQLKRYLSDNGCIVDIAVNGEEGLYMGREFPVEVAIVDIGLPDFSGIELIDRWRKEDLSFPVLVLTARSQWQQKVDALDNGADDYLVKPFHNEELLARLKALVRRAAGFAHPLLEAGPIKLDTVSQDVTVDDKLLELTAYEYKVLEYLMLKRGSVISKMALTDHLYEQDFERDSNVIEVFIGRLRKKLDPNGTLNPIETLRGRGYRFTI